MSTAIGTCSVLVVLFIVWLWATPAGQGQRFCRTCNRMRPYGQRVCRCVASLTLAATAMALLALAAPARADEASFIDYMRSHGQWVLPGGEGGWIAGGNTLCTQLRQGAPRAQVERMVSPMNGRDPVVYVDAAQHELCPDTLR